MCPCLSNWVFKRMVRVDWLWPLEKLRQQPASGSWKRKWKRNVGGIPAHSISPVGPHWSFLCYHKHTPHTTHIHTTHTPYTQTQHISHAHTYILTIILPTPHIHTHHTHTYMPHTYHTYTYILTIMCTTPHTHIPHTHLTHRHATHIPHINTYALIIMYTTHLHKPHFHPHSPCTHHTHTNLHMLIQSYSPPPHTPHIYRDLAPFKNLTCGPFRPYGQGRKIIKSQMWWHPAVTIVNTDASWTPMVWRTAQLVQSWQYRASDTPNLASTIA